MKKFLLVIFVLACLVFASCAEHTHTWENETVITEPTEEKEGLARYTCSDCGEETEKVLEKLPHIHIYFQGWETTENEHYHPCILKSCTQTESKGAHIWGDDVIISEATQDTKGQKTKTCQICEMALTFEYTLGQKTDNGEWQNALGYKFDNQTLLYKEIGTVNKELKAEYANGWIQYTDEAGNVTQDINKENRELSTAFIVSVLSPYKDKFDSFTYNEEVRAYEYETSDGKISIQITDSRVTFITVADNDKTVIMEFSDYGSTSFEINSVG